MTADATGTEADATHLGRRGRYNLFIARHEIAWELGMGFLAIVFVALGFAIDQVGEGQRPELEALEIGLTLVFLLEFVTRIVAAFDRLQYLRGHAIDLIALAPPIRAARVLRLLRLLRLVRVFSGVYRASMHVQGLASHRGFAWLVSAWLAVMVLCSFVLYAAEHGINTAIESPFDALWWGVVTISTVGYGDVYPITFEGKLAAIVLMLLGIGLFSAITATATSYMLSTRQQAGAPPGSSLASELALLAELRSQGSLTESEFERAKEKLIGRG
jgi:voltage-gated potassium channel